MMDTRSPLLCRSLRARASHYPLRPISASSSRPGRRRYRLRPSSQSGRPGRARRFHLLRRQWEAYRGVQLQIARRLDLACTPLGRDFLNMGEAAAVVVLLCDACLLLPQVLVHRVFLPDFPRERAAWARAMPRTRLSFSDSRDPTMLIIHDLDRATNRG